MDLLQKKYGNEDLEAIIFFSITELAKNRYLSDNKVNIRVGRRLEYLDIDYPNHPGITHCILIILKIRYYSCL
jgi:hypothetical protein